MKVVQLTSLNGLETSPTFSPDGTQVAFSWNGEREGNYDIYVKTVGSSDVRRLTTDPADDTNPVWSPDGKEIAFLRDHPGGGTNVYSVLPTGGGERKLSDFRIAGGPSARIAWSPDQRWIVGRPDSAEDLARNGSWALYLIPLGSGTPRRLTEAKAPDIDLSPTFSPDGRRLAYVACANFSGRNCRVSVLELGADYTPAGPPRPLANARQNRSIAWSRDGASVVYDTNARGRWELWRMSVDGGGEPERLEMAGDHSRQPAIAPAGDRLAFERASQGLSVYKLRASGEPEPVLVSPAWDYNPQFSPDGRRIAFSSMRSGDRGRDLVGVGRRFRRAATDARPWDASDPAGMVARRTPHCLRIDRRQRPRRHLGHSRRRRRPAPGHDGSWRRKCAGVVSRWKAHLLSFGSRRRRTAGWPRHLAGPFRGWAVHARDGGRQQPRRVRVARWEDAHLSEPCRL